MVFVHPRFQGTQGLGRLQRDEDVSSCAALLSCPPVALRPGAGGLLSRQRLAAETVSSGRPPLTTRLVCVFPNPIFVVAFESPKLPASSIPRASPAAEKLAYDCGPALIV